MIQNNMKRLRERIKTLNALVERGNLNIGNIEAEILELSSLLERVQAQYNYIADGFIDTKQQAHQIITNTHSVIYTAKAMDDAVTNDMWILFGVLELVFLIFFFYWKSKANKLKSH